MAFLKTIFLTASVFAAVSLAPLTARAIEVECELKDGSTCTVRNDPNDFSSCACADESGTVGGGGNEWEDFDEEQLLEICLSELDICAFADTDGGTGGMTTTTGATTVDPTEAMDTGDDSGAGSGSTGGPGSTGGGTAGEGSSSTGDTPGGSGPSTTPSDTDSNGTASGGDSGPATTTGPAPSGEESGDGSSSSGAGEDNEDPSGCSVEGRGRSGGLLFSLFGVALGLKRRRRR
ncbi:MAG: MYXO-CTERM sorting domain-containing protein [Nannocystales bacterium]